MASSMAPSSTLCWVSWRVSAKCLLARTISLCKWSDSLQVRSREQATHVPGTQVHGVGGVDDGVHMAPVGMLLHVADVPNLVSNAVGGTCGTRGRSCGWMTIAPSIYASPQAGVGQQQASYHTSFPELRAHGGRRGRGRLHVMLPCMNLCLDVLLSCLAPPWLRCGSKPHLSFRFIRRGVDSIMEPAAEPCQALDRPRF